MIYTVDKIVRDVRVAIDENRKSTPLVMDGDVDTLSLDEIVRSKIVDSARMVLTDAPVELLDGGVPLDGAIYWRDGGRGWMLLPDDFLRLLIFRMSDWERPVYGAIGVTDAEYALQYSRYRGLRGTPQKPVVAIVRRAEGLALELFSCRSEDATLEQGMYIRVPKVDHSGGIDLPERCYRSIVYGTASLVLASIGSELSATMGELSKGSLV